MVIRKNMTNEKIYDYATKLLNAFEDMSKVNLPVKVAFYLQKNMDRIIEMGKDIEKNRTEILSKYGKLNEETQNYNFEPDDIDTVNKEILDLFTLEQEVKYNAIPLDWLDDVELNGSQVAALSYMIEENDAEEEE